MMEAFSSLGLDILNIGETELDGGIGFLEALLREASITGISANLVGLDGGPPLFPPFRIVEPRTPSGTPKPGAPKVAVIGLTEPARYSVISTPGGGKAHFEDPVKVAGRVVAEARGQADVVIVLANFGVGTARRVADSTPGIDLIIGADARIEDPMQDATSGVPIVMTGVLGKRSIRIDFRKSGEGWEKTVDITEVNLKTEVDPAADEFMSRFDRVLQGRTRERAEAQRGDPRATKYVGAAACASCHPAEFETWKASRHAHAWEPLEESKNTLNPLCMGCHSTGYLKPNGFFIESLQPELVAVGCESCHGPGGKHITAPFQEKVLRGDENTCRTCHTPGQTPDFEFPEFWPKIRH